MSNTINFEVKCTTSYPRLALEQIKELLNPAGEIRVESHGKEILNFDKTEKDECYFFFGSCNLYDALEAVALLPQGSVSAKAVFRFKRFSIDLDYAKKLHRTNSQIVSLTQGENFAHYCNDKEFPRGSLHF